MLMINKACRRLQVLRRLDCEVDSAPEFGGLVWSWFIYPIVVSQAHAAMCVS